MSENLPEENKPEEVTEGGADEELDPDELEKELLDAMKDLGRKNKKIEEYLDGLTHPTEKPANEKTDTQSA